jgi:hypothetical protein
MRADPSARAVSGVGLWPLVYWDCGFESRRGHGCLSRVSVVCCQVEVSARGRSLVRRSRTECGVSDCNHEASIVRRPWPIRGCCAMSKKLHYEGIWGSGDIAPCILSRGSIWGWVWASRPSRCTPGGGVPITRWISYWVGPQSHNQNSSILQQVASSLFRVRYTVSYLNVLKCVNW